MEIPGLHEFIQSIKYLQKGVVELVNYFLSFLGLSLGSSALILLNVIILAGIVYMIWENKPLRYIMILIIILVITNIFGILPL